MNFKILSFSFVAFCTLGASCKHATVNLDNTQKSQPGSLKTVTTAFYNVENLFDTIDDPKIIDEDFLPTGKLQWTKERYETKLDRLAEVIDRIPGDLPAFVGLCEIENKSVLEDLIKSKRLSAVNYAIIHQDSPDERGIDVAVLYNPAVLGIEEFHYYTVSLPDVADPNTRDLLYIKAKMQNEVIHFFVNHWPSRGGGQAESEINRITAAQILRKKIDEVLAENASAKILIMGDFNDYPTDKSITQILDAGIADSNILFDYMYDDHVSGKGSYFYKGEWGALDQFIGSKELKASNHGWSAPENNAHIFREEFLLFTDGDGKSRPNRTYAGDSYKGGYSDHLPIYITLDLK